MPYPAPVLTFALTRVDWIRVLALKPLGAMLPRFLAVGVIGLAVDASAFWLVSRAGLSLPLARALSLILATAVTWQLNRRFTFGASGRVASAEGARYALVAAVAQGFNWALFLALHHLAPKVPILLVLVASAACATLLSFAGQRAITFSPPRLEPPVAPGKGNRWRFQAVLVGASLLLAVPWLMGPYRPADGWLDVTGHPVGRDFINFWIGPQLAFSERWPALFDPVAYQAALGDLFGRPMAPHLWSYPPSVLPILWPFAQLPYGLALAAWTLAGFTAFAAVTLSRVPPGRRVEALMLLAVAPASLINVAGGQNGFFTAALLLVGILQLERRPLVAGGVFGLLTVKPHIGLALAFALLAIGAWRAIIVATVAAAALLGASVVLLGVEPWQAFINKTGPLHGEIMRAFEGFFTLMMTSVYASARISGLTFSSALILQGLISGVAIAATLWAFRRTGDARRRATILAVTTPLVTPYAFNYDLTALTAVAVWSMVSNEGERPWARSVVALAWLTPLLSMGLSLHGIGVAPVVLLAFLALTLVEIARDQEEPAPSARTVSEPS